MGGDDAPGALHHDLREEGAEGDQPTVVDQAKSGTIGRPSRAAMMIIRLRPNRSDMAPTASPPMIAPML